MGTILEPFEDLTGLSTHLDPVASGILPEQASAHFTFVTGRQLGNAMQHLPGSTVSKGFFAFLADQMGLFSSEYWTVQLAFKWDRQTPTQAITTIDLFNAGPLALKLFLVPSNKPTNPNTFVAAPASATSALLASFSSLSQSNERMLQGVWYIARMRARIHPTLGSYDISITRDSDGAVVTTFSGSNTNTTGAVGVAGAFSTQIRTIPGLTIDDLRITTGVSDNALDPVDVVFFRRPTYVGSSSQWTKSDPLQENWQHVDEVSPSSLAPDANTLSAATVGTQDLHGYETVPPTIPSSAPIPRVTLSFYGYGSSVRSVRALHRTGGGTETLMGAGAMDVVPGTIQRRSFEALANPATLGAWTVSDLSPSQFGFRVIS